MKKNKKQPLEVPPIEVLEKELHRELYKKSYRSTLRSTVYTLITVAAVAVLVATLVLPVLQIYGTSMTPTLSDGDIVVSVSGSEFEAAGHMHFTTIINDLSKTCDCNSRTVGRYRRRGKCFSKWNTSR